MDFAELLATLLDFTGSSISELANFIKYDRSYVSKWVNKKEIPTSSTWEDTRDNLVAFFDEKLTNFDVERLKIQIPYIAQIVDDSDKEGILYKLLEETYTYAKNRQDLDSFDEENTVALLVKNKDNVSEYILNLIIQSFYRASEATNLFYTGDFISIFKDRVIDNFHMSLVSPTEINIRFTSDITERNNEDSVEILMYINRYFRLISHLSFVNFEIFSATSNKNKYYKLASKDNIYAWGFDIEDRIPSTLFVTENKSIVDKNYVKLEESFAKKEPLLKLNKDYHFVFKSLDDYETNARPIFYTPRLYLYMASNDLREKMFEERAINKLEYDAWGIFRDSVDSEKYKNAYYIIPESAFSDTIKSGWIYKPNGGIQVFGENYKLYTEEIFNTYNNSNTYFIEDTKLENSHRLPKCMIYSDKELAFILKTNQATPYNYDNIFYQSYNQDFTECIYYYLNALTNINENNFLNY